MDVFFTREHEWIRIEGGTATVGITGYAVEQLGDITFVELPRIGKEVAKAEVLCVVESVKAVGDVYAPVAGRVTEVNGALESEPEILNRGPEDEGWMARIEISDPNEAAGLMTRPDYDEYLRGLE